MSERQLPRVALLNLMPSAVFSQTAEQWKSLLEVGGETEFIPVRFDDDPRLGTGCGSEYLVEACTPVSTAEESGIDALIITGANLERRADGSPLPFQDIRYYEPLTELITRSRDSNRLTVYSCLASHIALKHVYGLERDIAERKHLGVYEHSTAANWLTEGLDSIRAPHSRWGTIGTKLLEGSDITVAACSPEVGWLLAEADNAGGGKDVFIQGHPEYWAGDLDKEYKRDSSEPGFLPEHYYPDDDPDVSPIFSWEDDATQLFRNIRAHLETYKTTD